MAEEGVPSDKTLPEGGRQSGSDLTPKMKKTMAEMMTTMMAAMQENICKKLDEYMVGDEASPEDDATSNHATNDCDVPDPPSELQTTHDVVDKYLDEVQPSQISWEHRSQEFSVAEKTGPAIDDKLAQLIADLLPEKLPKTKLEELVEKYPRPDNCPLLVAPRCNKAVWHQLKLPPKTLDTSLQKCQKLLVASLCAIIQATAKATDELKIPLTHAIVLALSANWEFNQKRRDLLRPHLNSRYSALCNPSTPITTELFGDDIGKEIDEVTKTSRLGLKLSTPRKERPRFHSYMVHLFVVLKAHQHSNDVTTEPSTIFFRRTKFLSSQTRREVRQHTNTERTTITSDFHCNQVSYINTIHSLLEKQSKFVGGQIRFHIQQWREITSDPYVLLCLTNCHLELEYEPSYYFNQPTAAQKFSTLTRH
jgi:hypothetical protein